MSATEDALPAAVGGSSTITGFVTHVNGGFAAVRAHPETGTDPPPAPASARRYLRDGLPALYRERVPGASLASDVQDEEAPFALRFVGALEEVLDPIVALLDALPAHFAPALAPRDVLELLASWLGVSHSEDRSPDELRLAVMRAADLGRMRGTKAGIELALRLHFPALPLRVEDAGTVAWSLSEPLAAVPLPSFVVYCETPIGSEMGAAVARLIEEVKPVHVSYRLRIREPSLPGGGHDQ